MASIFAPEASSQSPFPYVAAGAAGGVALDRAYMAQKSAAKRSNWALGIGIGLVALTAVSSSGLNADQSNAQSVINRLSNLTFTTGGAVTGEEVAALRAATLELAGVVQKVAYDANLYAFDGAPTPPVTPTQIASVTQTTQVQTNNNNAGLLVVLLGLGFAVYSLTMD